MFKTIPAPGEEEEEEEEEELDDNNPRVVDDVDKDETATRATAPFLRAAAVFDRIL